MGEESWEDRYAREEKEHTARALAAWEKTYKKRKPLEKNEDDVYTEYIFDEDTIQNEDSIQVKTVNFRFMDDGSVYMRRLVNKRSLFLVVSGPLAGKRIPDENEEYILFNRSGRHGKDVPKCVLVHRNSL